MAFTTRISVDPLDYDYRNAQTQRPVGYTEEEKEKAISIALQMHAGKQSLVDPDVLVKEAEVILKFLYGERI